MTKRNKEILWLLVVFGIVLIPALIIADGGTQDPNQDGGKTSTGSGDGPGMGGAPSCDPATEECGDGDETELPGGDPEFCRLTNANDPPNNDHSDFGEYMECIMDEAAGSGYERALSFDVDGNGVVTYWDLSGPINDICHIENNEVLRHLAVELHQATGVGKINVFVKDYNATGVDFRDGSSPSEIELTIDDTDTFSISVFGPSNVDGMLAATINAHADYTSYVLTNHIIIERNDGTGIGKLEMLNADTGLHRSGLSIDPTAFDFNDCTPLVINPPPGSGGGR